MTAAARPTAVADRTDRLVDAITATVAGDSPWDAPSPCEGWTAAQVLDHLVGTERVFLTAHGVELGPLPDGDPAARWRTHGTQVVDALADPAVVDLEYDGYFGPTTVGESFSTFYTFDLVVHRWDLARAFGRDAALDDADLDLVEATLDHAGDALYADGICAPPVDVPADSSRTDRLVARTGRDPRR